MDTIDDIGRRAAAAVQADAAAIADAEADALLDALAASAATVQRPTRRWAILGAAAAVAAAIAAGVVVVVNREPAPDLVPATTGPPNPVTTPPPTTPPASSVAPSTTAPAATTTTPPPSPDDGLAVSYKNPPPFLEPQLIGTVELTNAEIGNGITVMEGGVVVVDGTNVTVVGWDGTTRSVEVQPDFEFSGWIVLAAGPGDILYAAATGVDQTNMSVATIVAIPLSGERAGQVVATTPADVNTMIERPAGWVGHGPFGIVDREGLHGQLAAYVDDSGAPLPDPLAIPEYRKDGDTISSVDGTLSWSLQIERAPNSGSSFVGEAPPAPAPSGAVWWDTIGPPGSGGDYPLGTIPVIAFLSTDGTAAWRQIPEGWGVIAADAWGAVLVRINGTRAELARATPAAAMTPAPSVVEQAATDYLTALAGGDYETAATLLGNDGLSPEVRPDLAPLRRRLEDGAPLSDALREWCTSDGAVCWLPRRVGDTGASTVGDQPDGTIVIANYDDRDVGVQGRFVVDSWEGQPSVYGLPPLADPLAASTLRELLGVDTLWILHPDDQLANGRRSAVVTTSAGPRNVMGPPDTSALTIASDGQTLWWSVGEGGTIVTDTAGTVVCSVAEQIIELLGDPGAYRAVVARWGEAGPQDEPLPTPTFEIDCATGAETPVEPRSWNGGPVTRRVRTVGDRRFTSTGTDHHVEIVNESGLELGADDRIITEPVFSPDGSIVVYGDNTGSANPLEVTRYVARDTSTDELLWTYDPPTTVIGVKLTADRAIFSTSIDDALPALGTTSVTALDLTTGQELITVPATFTLLHVE